ncbi:hypothetical protein P4S93_09020 [Aneurinibacillus thermoaerophilus]|uniref:hypothetical protein n=1 Tax=Aneurinibacillus thermoaerophilus TaxID=143495 RepID=UPI002E20D42F|nr:hypothetical protein [Aneurinibacillus thermoaerophilus]MED0760918.1 hypothetical protein [Aneurinibacillus thermoaerophilus]
MTNTKRDVEAFSSQLSEKIWGHRFRDGQKGAEYLLEFLNVMWGTGYQLGASEYKRKQMTGFRQFVFEGMKEGSKSEAPVQLDPEKKKRLLTHIKDDEKVSIIKNFLVNLEVPLYDKKGKEANRSWYARSLYPLHESLLFFELRTKGKNISFERNFYARGGELYYLMLTYGTRNNVKLKEQIETRLRDLLQRNKKIEHLVNELEQIIENRKAGQAEGTPQCLKKNDKGQEYPHLPVEDCALFPKFAKQFAQVISMRLDIYELFRLLTSLICYHLTLYMNQRASEGCTGDTCVVEELIQCKVCQTTYFFDCLDAQVPQIRKLASDTFTKNETLIKRKFESYFKRQFFGVIGEEEQFAARLIEWKQNPDAFLEDFGLKSLREPRRGTIKKALEKCTSYQDATTHLYNKIKDIISDQLKRQQLNITRGLAVDGGFGGYRPGESYRYFISDDFLQAIVYATVEPNKSMEFHEFLQLLYKEFGIVIAEKEARQTGLYEQSKLNIKYFQMNEKQLREKLKHNGLLIEYSDATAMIHNPYEAAQEVMA